MNCADRNSPALGSAAAAAVLLLCAFLCAIPLAAQTVTISGTVKDGNTYRPLADVNITVPGTRFGCSSDAAGFYSLSITDVDEQTAIVFQHVSYESRSVRLADLRRSGDVYLTPRVIPFESTEITGTRLEGAAAKDIPQTVSTIESREFEVRGYVDAGDLLRTEHSIQIDEQFSGKKLVSMRGGNPDEVIVLYDGIKLNGSYTSDFDLSLIELSDVERFEIIKGSNSTLYGSEAFSGVINIVPKEEREYTVRLHQQIGSYDSGIWGLQLYRRFGRFAGSYSLRNGGMTRAFEDLPEDKLTNSSMHHSGSLSYRFSEDAQPADALTLHWRTASLEYVNERDGEQLDDRNSFAGLQYAGGLPLLGDIKLVAGYNGLRQDMTLNSTDASVERGVHEDGGQGSIEKRWAPGIFDFLFSYQFSHAQLDVGDIRRNLREQPIGIASTQLTRSHHGLVAIGKLHGETGSSFFRSFDFDASLRQDFVSDAQDEVVLREQSIPDGAFSERDWSHTIFKFAIDLKGMKENFLLDVFLSYGNNVRYPTLFQQVNSPALLDPSRVGEALEVETNRSVEVGGSLTRSLQDGAVSGWEVQGSFFQNSYDNKFRSISTPGIPLTLYDNVDNAQISGLEAKAALFFWGKKVLTEFGLSRYFISEQSAFPFKSDSKRTISILLDHAGYSLQLFHFAESSQIGLLRQPDGTYAEVELPSFSNIDVHASKFFDIGKFQLFVNISLRNILNSENVVLSGLALRDRRYYLTAGIQY
ncbi:MAG: TonB-dependent receptor plug domain-containing protein [Bacteroidetes bacterium]|nr:TonB-dependent receptor plug domain-containing protein [Bacteroidota bacterium]